ncbi:MAG: aminotransferase class V-fold PLP-dependent enzyme [Acidobacteria bacterium]|nr:aminotransferase class V-fold PLP-dependent enzyme [Acidobacteriota bacterium]MCA1608506.1 aminotransferase class V-fold PLP-dependent enzyme [Acidobacteriota bacterium]
MTWLDVDKDGLPNVDQLRKAVSENTAVGSVMMANDKTGVLFPVRRFAEIVKENSNALFQVDGVNAAGKVPVDLKSTEIDLFPT